MTDNLYWMAAGIGIGVVLAAVAIEWLHRWLPPAHWSASDGSRDVHSHH